jgi:cell division septum initiation protein DivIVA
MPDQSSAATEHAILAEITRPLEALPDDPLAYVDADFPTALRGYDRVAVDEYVRQTRQLVAELQATRSPEAAVRRALERVGEQISGILQRAHETAEQITAQSRSEAEDRLEQARVEAAQVAYDAEQRVKELDVDTDRIWLERQCIVADAEDLAAQLLALAKTAAERFPADAEPAGTVAFEAEDEPPAPYGDADELGPQDEGGHDGDDIEDAEAAGDEAGGADDDDVATTATERQPAEPDERSEVERTMPFRPLEPDDSGPLKAEGDQLLEGEDTQPPGGQRSTADDDTAVIPPASQAANRRTNQ